MLIVTTTRRGAQLDAARTVMALYVASRRGVRLVTLVSSGGTWRGTSGYIALRWVWLNAVAKSRASRLEALPGSLPSGSQSCLICVGRTHPLWGGPGQRLYLG